MTTTCTLPASVDGITLPEHRATYSVTGFIRYRNYVGGPMLTLSVGTWQREGCTRVHDTCDIATRMKLADLLSDKHEMPVNADRLYGKLGRGCKVGRAVARAA